MICPFIIIVMFILSDYFDPSAQIPLDYFSPGKQLCSLGNKKIQA